MLTDNDKINGLPIRTEIRIPREGSERQSHGWFSSVVVCQDTDKETFVVWSVFQAKGQVHAENGIYDIRDYGRALEKAVARAQSALC